MISPGRRLSRVVLYPQVVALVRAGEASPTTSQTPTMHMGPADVRNLWSIHSVHSQAPNVPRNRRAAVALGTLRATAWGTLLYSTIRSARDSLRAAVCRSKSCCATDPRRCRPLPPACGVSASSLSCCLSCSRASSALTLRTDFDSQIVHLAPRTRSKNMLLRFVPGGGIPRYA